MMPTADKQVVKDEGTWVHHSAAGTCIDFISENPVKAFHNCIFLSGIRLLEPAKMLWMLTGLLVTSMSFRVNAFRALNAVAGPSYATTSTRSVYFTGGRPLAATKLGPLFASSHLEDEASTKTISLSSEILCGKAKDFIEYKNAAGCGENDLERIFTMCSKNADIYGLRGEGTYRPGLIKFFDQHKGLQHTFIEEPKQLGPNTVQYSFTKSWQNNDTDKREEWKSIDPNKPRNKVERLQFDSNGMLMKVSVVEESEPLC